MTFRYRQSEMAGCVFVFLLAVLGLTIWSNPSIDPYIRFVNDTLDALEDVMSTKSPTKSPSTVKRFIRSFNDDQNLSFLDIEPDILETTDVKDDFSRTTLVNSTSVTEIFEKTPMNWNYLSLNSASPSEIDRLIDELMKSATKEEAVEFDEDTSLSLDDNSYEFSFDTSSTADFNTVDYTTEDVDVTTIT